MSRFLVDSERRICIYIENKRRILGRVLLKQCKVAKISTGLNKLQHPESIWDTWCTALSIVPISIRRRRVISFAAWPFYPQGKRQRSSLNRKLGGTHTRPQSFEKEINFCSFTVTMRTELLRLHHKVVSQPSNCRSPGKEGEDRLRRDKLLAEWRMVT